MNTQKLYTTLSKFPGGKHIFSFALCLKAPYFGTIRPFISKLDNSSVRIDMKKRRKVQNHLSTVHAIAMCNMAELAAGLLTDVSIPKSMRWIPKNMSVNYLKKATTNLYAIADGELLDWNTSGDKIVNVNVFNLTNEKVFEAKITMYLSAKS